MPELNLSAKIKRPLESFVEELKTAHGQKLISVILYGSGAGSEFLEKASNLNVMVVLSSADIEELKKSAGLLRKFRSIAPLYLTQEYIRTSLDIFPIEFLDMQENYHVLYGQDVLVGLSIDTRNLRFQCEQELKSRLLGLRQAYLRAYKDSFALKQALIRTFTSVLHLARNVLRLKGAQAPYGKQELLARLGREFHINDRVWERILDIKSGRVKLRAKDTEALFGEFITDLEKLVDSVDKI